MTIRHLPTWFYGAIAALLIVVLAIAWGQLDAVGRVELALPAVFWTAAFITISLRRRLAHR